MNETVNHVISRLKWDTSFDDKEKATALQERLSTWGKLNMQNEVAAVFDKMCPAEQTWRIQSLELDLGPVDFDNLEFELTLKLRQQLSDKLMELITYAHKNSGNIEILDQNLSHVQMIGQFLVQGLLPWSHKPTDGSVNQMLTGQLQLNRVQLMVMLRELGLTHEQVRKRMSWQINEPNIIRIIEGLEPNNGSLIVEFSNELAKLQLKEMIVQASNADFKKSLWSWVFNYLFTERGTVFNRIQFMKSSIRQMSVHYNIKYDQLFEMIELAVLKVSQSLNLQPDFLLTLNLLSNEYKASRKNDSVGNEDQVNYWEELSSSFKNASLRRTVSKNIAFNELVVSLSKEDKERFFTLISSFGHAADFWLPVIDDLNEASLETILSAVDLEKSIEVSRGIHFLSHLSAGLSSRISRKIWWYTGLLFLQAHKNTSFNRQDFLYAMVYGVSERNQLNPASLLYQLLSVKIPSSARTLLNLDLYTHLQAIYTTATKGVSAAAVQKEVAPHPSLRELFVRDPGQFLLVIRHDGISMPHMVALHRQLGFATLLRTIGRLNPPQQLFLRTLDQFYVVLGSLAIGGWRTAEIQQILFSAVMGAWKDDDWKAIATENIWNVLIWDACIKKGITKKEFFKHLEKGKFQFPASLQLSLESLKNQDTQLSISQQPMVTRKNILPKQGETSGLQESISVRNAGVVLISNYIPVLFERLGLIDTEKKFMSAESQSQAVHYLQYVVTGLSATEEAYLPLNKVLCGLDIPVPVPYGIEVSPEQGELVEGLILAIISHWSSIGSSSVAGFRGNWLVRDGVLKEKEDRWELTVDKRPYDLLINTAPFSFSVIRYPWMKKALHVHWPH